MVNWDDLHNKLNKWELLPEDWDGYDSICPSNTVIKYCHDFLYQSQKYNIAVPEIYIAGDGEIGFRWNTDLYASVSFLNDGNIIIFCQKPKLEPLRIDTFYSESLNLDQFFDILIQNHT